MQTKPVYLADNTETPTPGYTLFDAGWEQVLPGVRAKYYSAFILQLIIYFDIAYQSHLSRLKYFEQYPDNGSGRNGIYDMGRNISFEVEVPIDFK